MLVGPVSSLLHKMAQAVVTVRLHWCHCIVLHELIDFMDESVPGVHVVKLMLSGELTEDALSVWDLTSKQ